MNVPQLKTHLEENAKSHACQMHKCQVETDFLETRSWATFGGYQETR